MQSIPTIEDPAKVNDEILRLELELKDKTKDRSRTQLDIEAVEASIYLETVTDKRLTNEDLRKSTRSFKMSTSTQRKELLEKLSTLDETISTLKAYIEHHKRLFVLLSSGSKS